MLVSREWHMSARQVVAPYLLIDMPHWRGASTKPLGITQHRLAPASAAELTCLPYVCDRACSAAWEPSRQASLAASPMHLAAAQQPVPRAWHSSTPSACRARSRSGVRRRWASLRLHAQYSMQRWRYLKAPGTAPNLHCCSAFEPGLIDTSTPSAVCSQAKRAVADARLAKARAAAGSGAPAHAAVQQAALAKVRVR
jgi:hypothetical protein